MTLCQHHSAKIWKKAILIKDKKTPESSKAFKAKVAKLEEKIENNSNEHLFADEKPQANDRNNPALDRKRSRTRWSHTDT